MTIAWGGRTPGRDRRLMGDLLVEAGVASRAAVAAGLEEQRLRGGRLGFNLMKIGRVTPAAFYLFLKDNPSVLAEDLAEPLHRAPAVDLLPAGLAHHYGMMPLRSAGGVLDLALSTVDAPRLLPAIEELTGLRVEPLICPPAVIRGALARFYPSEVEPGVVYNSCGDNMLIVSARDRGIRPRRPESVPEDASAAEWLRAIAAEGVACHARRIHIEPARGEMRVRLGGAPGREWTLALPAGAYPGVAGIIEGLSRLAERGRVLPRDGRMSLVIDRRHAVALVRALPGIEGTSYTLDLREERAAVPSGEELARDHPGLARAVRDIGARGRGLMLVAGPGPGAGAFGVAAVLALLGDRLPRRIALGDGPAPSGVALVGACEDEERVPRDALLSRALAEGPDLLVLADRGRAADAASALALAEGCAVIMTMRAADAFDAAQQLVWRGAGESGAAGLAGILAVRLMEKVCASCRVPFDMMELLSPGPRHRAVMPGDFYWTPGCEACRGGGAIDVEPVFEFLAGTPGDDLLRRGSSAEGLRENRARQGMPTLLRGALERAAAGRIDVREPLRLLLHEQY